MFGKRQAKPADDAPAKQPAVAVPEPALEQPAATPEIVAEPATSSLDGDAQAEIAASNDSTKAKTNLGELVGAYSESCKDNNIKHR